ncbi:MAG: beta-ketoacyl synthase N-terminal-like domain-containing protein [Vicinamibacterales bacterium]|nr:beta-ketoacyl synthase N-terminal-like domain-containing protein [Vicinamibacterales bacterium]
MTSHLLLHAAPSLADLTGIVAEVRAAIRDARALPAGAPDGSHRLAVIYGSDDELEARLARVAGALASGQPFVHPGAAYYGVAAGAPAPAAALFPGYGVRRTTLVGDLAREVPAVEAWLDALGVALGTYQPGQPRAASSALPTMSLEAVLLADLAVWHALGAAGWRPDVIAGHSFGEHAALVASARVADFTRLIGVLDEIGAMAAARRTEGGALAPGMLALTAASRPLLQPLLDAAPPRLHLALDNCPQQIVVWGEAGALDELERAARARREVAFRLPDLDGAVHTPRFPLPHDEIRRAYDGVTITPGVMPMWSAASLAPVPDDPEDVRDLLALQWHRPVRFRELVRRLYDEGVRTFVEVGPADRLSGFVRDTLRGSGVTTIPTNIEGRAALTQIHAALAQLFVRGHALDADALRGPSRPRLEARTARVPAAFVAPQDDAGVRAVAAEVEAILGGSLEPADYERGFFELGLGSMGCVTLAAALERTLGVPVAQTLPFDHPTVRRLAAALAAPAAVDPGRAAPATRTRGPIAIVGIGCRFPGGEAGPEAFWEALAAGHDAVTAVPPDRPSPQAMDPSRDPDARRRQAHGAFLRDIKGFDAAFFGISPREAEALDPQQRLLLEVAWEALEHAAIDPSSLAGSATGVYVGISHADYASRLTPAGRLAVGGYLGTGNAHSTAAGRLSYVLGLRGPCLAVDTACSSSLAALHLACEGLHRGDCAVAIAGGVHLLVSPESTVYLSHALALSPTGRCRTFDAGADGYVRGEGAGLVVLKRLDEARAAGDRVLAVVHGSAINHDGRTSGFTVPSGPAQEAVIRQALDAAQCTPGAISYVEAHGTGTALGDPIEIGALGRVFGGRPADDPVRLGSVKTAIGHLEAAAGIAGVIKVVLQLQHATLTPTLHFTTPNPRAAWRDGLRVVSATTAWETPAPRLAGVSSFGISGTNAHVILGEGDAPSDMAPARDVEVLPLSAHTASALAAGARRLASSLEAAPQALGAVARTLATGRAHLGVRRAIVVHADDDVVARLRALADETPRASASAPRLAWLFTGQGAQRPGMGRALYAREPVFRAAFDACDRELSAQLDGSLREVVFGDDAARLAQTGWAQPALFAVEYALAALWQHWGVRPQIVAGHSVGEVVAATVAGVCSLEEGLRLIAARASLMQSLPAGGGMLAVEGDPARVGALAPPEVVVAAINAPDQVVLSGPGAAIAEAARILAREGLRVTPLAVSHAFHSPLMAPIVDRFRAEVAALTLRPPSIPIVSNRTGRLAGDEIATADYWVDHLLEPVQFARTVETLVEQGVTAALEIGPQPVLIALASRAPAAAGLTWLPSLAPPAGEAERMGESLAALYEQGLSIDWTAVHDANPSPRIALPTTVFEREAYWIEPDTAAPHLAGRGAATLAGVRRRDPEDAADARFALDTSAASLLLACAPDGTGTVPVASLIALALAIGGEVQAPAPMAVEDLAILTPLARDAEAQVVVMQEGASRWTARLHAREPDGGWRVCASWSLIGGAHTLDGGRTAGSDETATITGEDFYARAAHAGLAYPVEARSIETLHLGAAAADARVRPATRPGLGALPGIEAVAQVLAAAYASSGGTGRLEVTGCARAIATGPLPATATVTARWTAEGEGLAATAQAVDEAGVVVLSLVGLTTTASASPAARGTARLADRLREADAGDRRALVAQFLTGAVGGILRLPAGRPIAAELPLSRAGLDSLMALQLAAVIQRECGVAVPVGRIVDGATVASLAGVVAAGGDAASGPTPATLRAAVVDGEL